MRSEKSIGLVLAFTLAVVGPGCGDDDSGSSAAAGSGGGAGSGGAAGATGGAGGSSAAGGGAGTAGHAGVAGSTGESLTVLVTDGEGAPLDGATVAFDAPDGARSEATTSAEGKATFTGIDWTAGEAAVTAFMEGHRVRSLVHLDGDTLVKNDDDELPLTLSSLAEETVETVTVIGSATGLVDSAHTYTVNIFGAAEVPTVDGSEWSGTGTQTFVINVPKGVPFRLQAFEHVRTMLPSGQGYERPISAVMQMELGPIDVNTSGVVLDFEADKVATSTADVSMILPSRADSPLRTGAPYCFVCARNSHYCEGWPTFLDIAASGDQFDMSFLWAEHPNVVEPNWFCRVTNGEEMGYAIVDGYPQDGGQGTILDVPRWITPSDTTSLHPIDEPLEWEWFEADVPESSVSLVRNGTGVWYIHGGPNATSITIPELPSVTSLSEVLGGAARAIVYGGEGDAEGRWVRKAQSKSVPLEY